MPVALEAFKLIASSAKQTEPFRWETQAVHVEMDSTNLHKYVTHAIPHAEHVWVFLQIVHHATQP